MTDKLKPCPLCNFPHDGTLSCSNPRCSLYWVSIPIEQWQNRPVEKYLRDWLEALDSGLTLPAQEEIERLKAEVSDLINEIADLKYSLSIHERIMQNAEKVQP